MFFKTFFVLLKLVMKRLLKSGWNSLTRYRISAELGAKKRRLV
jgi:hypothetical protein